MILVKATAYPIGTVRTWGGVKYRKAAKGKWVEVTDSGKVASHPLKDQGKVMEWWKTVSPEKRQAIMADIKADWDKQAKDWGKMRVLVNHVIQNRLMDVAPAAGTLPDYKTQGVKAPLFKSWFGDWENDPENASKVVKKDGTPAENYNLTPVRVYHGTSAGGFTEFKEDVQDPDALYGEGFYFTEDRGIAEDYSTTKDAKEEDLAEKASGYTVHGKPIQFFNETGIRKILDFNDFKNNKSALWQMDNPNWGPQIRKSLEGAYVPGRGYDVAKFLETFKAAHAAKGKAYRRYSSGLGMFYKMLKEVIPGIGLDTPKGEVFEVYLNIRKPFDMDAVLSRADVEQILADLSQPGVFHPYLDDILSIDDWESNIQNRVKGRELDYGDPMRKYTYDDLVAIRNVARSYKHRESQDASDWTNGWKAGDPVFPALHRNPDPENFTGEELTYILGNGGKDRNFFNKYLRTKGYDGIHHTGGWNIGTREHSVWIAFKPHQIKATANEGTFEPSNANIFKSKLVMYIRLRKARKG